MQKQILIINLPSFLNFYNSEFMKFFCLFLTNDDTCNI